MYKMYNCNVSSKDEFRYKLRGNNLLSFVNEYSEYADNIKAIQKVRFNDKFNIVSGIIKVDCSAGEELFLSHKLVPLVKAGMSTTDILITLQSRVILFEDKYGKLFFTSDDVSKLNNIGFKFNRLVSGVEISNKDMLLALYNSAEVLYYAPYKRITIKGVKDNKCSLTFHINDNTEYIYDTIFSEDEIKTLAKLQI